jgi:hypothetical protein
MEAALPLVGRRAERQVRRLLDTAPECPFVDEVFARAEGNAFFTEQVVAAGTRGDGKLAQGRRCRLVWPGCRSPERKRVATTAGRCSPRWASQDAIGRDRAGVDHRPRPAAATGRGAGIDRCLAHQAPGGGRPVPAADGRYRLRHALVGEAVAADMLAADRRERHATVARGSAANAGSDGSGKVAEHWAAAGEVNEELPGDSPRRGRRSTSTPTGSRPGTGNGWSSCGRGTTLMSSAVR